MQLRSCFLLVLLVGWAHSLTAGALYSVTALGTLGGSVSEGIAINNAGQVTGDSTTSTSLGQRAFLYSNGQMMDLGVLGGSSSFGKAINNAGQVTGDSIFMPFSTATVK